MLCTRNWTDEELKVAQEWIRRDSQNLPIGRHCYCPHVCYRRSNILAFYLFFSFFALIVFGFGIYVGYVFVRPYRMSLGFRNGTCVTAQSVVDTEPPWQSCSCGWWCRSEYPCLRIYVNVSTVDNDITNDAIALIHDSELYMDGPLEVLKCESLFQCSYEPECVRKKEQNRHLVDDFRKHLGTPGAVSYCMYDPYNMYRVITMQRSDPWWVAHLLLWPNIIALFFFGAIFITCLTCGHRYVCSTSPPEEISQEAAHRVGDTCMEPLSEHQEEGQPLRRTENHYSTINAEPC